MVADVDVGCELRLGFVFGFVVEFGVEIVLEPLLICV